MPEISNYGAPNGYVSQYTPESLRNRISTRDMGTRLIRDTPITAATSSLKPSKDDEVFCFVHSFFDDLPHEIISSAVTMILSIIKDPSLADEKKKSDIEEILDSSLDADQFEQLRAASQNTDQRSDEEDSMDFESDEDVDEKEQGLTDPIFISINDPVRLSDSSLIYPQDIDAHWLKRKLQHTNISEDDVLHDLHAVENMAYDEKFKYLQGRLGVANFGLAKLLAKNAGIIIWYTLLARAETVSERERILCTIREKGIEIEQIAQDTMEQDLPKEVDLQIVGKPLNIPVKMNVQLPSGSVRFTTHEYEQYNVPSNSSNKPVAYDWDLKQVNELPDYAKPCFEGIKSLNIIQSKACDTLVDTDNNVLMCAPTGAGKTNVALLALSRCVNVHKARAIYIAPLKALVQELVTTLQSKFFSSNITVAELSGDSSLSREQMKSVDIFVATPEKWDIISRKASNIDIVRTIGLVIIDEIHLLHDERRGGVIENIVTRHKLHKPLPRIVGLSATLPNYKDIAQFLDVPVSGLFYFDAGFRPVPLEQKFVGVLPKNPIKQIHAINQACAEKVSEIVVNEGRQVLVFVHSRKDTGVTRQFLIDNTSLGIEQIGVHHAGMDRDSRADAEYKFREGRYRALICTATLAWGVNLPAAAVIVKGTQYYDPSAEGWKELSPQDVLQMFGRAGRPGFDAKGLGVIITTQKYLSYFASVATLRLPIQSHLISCICDSLNAEIVNFTIRNIDDAVDWLKNTFWAVRCKTDPEMYGSNYTFADIAHSAMLSLHKVGACQYTYPYVKPTFQGEIAADFYLSITSLSVYTQQLKPWLSEIDLIRIFARSTEFSAIAVRREESGELLRLSPLMPYPSRDEVQTGIAKINILLQAYVSRLPLSGLALSSDMVYIAQTASRLFRAFIEIAVSLKWGKLAKTAARIFKMVDKRLWAAGQTPFRQFYDCPIELIEKAERSQLPWRRYFDLKAADLGQVLGIKDPNLISVAVDYLQLYPRFSLSVHCQPIAYEWILATIHVNSLFEYDDRYHTLYERFWLFIEDQKGNILHYSLLSMKELFAKSPLQIISKLKVKPSPVSQNYPPYLFARLLSERWLHAEYECPVSLRALHPPSQLTSTSQLSEKITNEISNISEKEFRSNVATVLRPLLESDRSAYVGLPPCCAETQQCADIVISNSTKKGENVLIVFSNLNEPQDHEKENVRYVHYEDGERLSRLPSRLSREFSDIDTVICKDLHMIGTKQGYKYEIFVMRIKAFLSPQKIVGFGYPISSARSVAQWLGASKSDVVNFAFDVVENPPQIEIRPWKGISSTMSALHSIKDVLESSSETILVTQTKGQKSQVAAELLWINILKENDVIIETSRNILNSTQFQVHKHTVVLLGTELLAVSEVFDIVRLGASRVLIFSDNPNFYEMCISNVIPVESGLVSSLVNAMIPEIVSNSNWSPQDAVNWLSTSFMYWRLRANPSYYGCHDLQEWVSETIESKFEYMDSISCVTLNEKTLEVSPLELAHVVTHNGCDLEDLLSGNINDFITIENDNDSAAGKFRKLRVIDALINLAVARGNLKELFRAIDLRQSLQRMVQLGISPLFQIPNFTSEIVLRCQDACINSIQDFIAIEEDDLRSTLLGFKDDDPRMTEVAEFVNQFPVVDIVEAKLLNNDTVFISIERDIEDDEEIADEGWYLVIGNSDTNEIIGYKHLNAIHQAEIGVSVELSCPLSDSSRATVWLMCGNYIDADKECPLAHE